MTALLAQSDATASITVASNGEAFACEPGQTLLLAGLAAGLDLPYECASGVCGACRCKLISGDVESLWPDAPGLSERDHRRGNVVLMCQSVPRGGCTIDVRVRGELNVPRPARLSGRIQRSHSLTHNMMQFDLALDRPMAFLPGQFVHLEIAGIGGRRAYSMANTDGDNARLRFIIKTKDGGLLSSRLCRTAIAGDPVTIEGPYGQGYFRASGDRPVVCIAGGSGLAPMWSIAQAAARQNGRQVHLYFGVNGTADVCFGEEFAGLRASGSRVRVETVIATLDHTGTKYRSGLVGDAVLTDLPDLTGCDVYMAGPPGMIDALLRRFVSESRIDSDRLFFDRFC